LRCREQRLAAERALPPASHPGQPQAPPPACGQVIVLSALRFHVPPEAWAASYRPLWLGAALLNTCYSYFWDLERDWEISFFSQMGESGGTGEGTQARQRGCRRRRWGDAGRCPDPHLHTPTCPRPRRPPPLRCAVPQRTLLPRPVLSPVLQYRRGFYLYLMASNLVLRFAWAYKLSPHLRRHNAVVFVIVLLEAFRWGFLVCCVYVCGWVAGWGQRAVQPVWAVPRAAIGRLAPRNGAQGGPACPSCPPACVLQAAP
jgi:hypothetical protein